MNRTMFCDASCVWRRVGCAGCGMCKSVCMYAYSRDVYGRSPHNMTTSYLHSSDEAPEPFLPGWKGVERKVQRTVGAAILQSHYVGFVFFLTIKLACLHDLVGWHFRFLWRVPSVRRAQLALLRQRRVVHIILRTW